MKRSKYLSKYYWLDLLDDFRKFREQSKKKPLPPLEFKTGVKIILEQKWSSKYGNGGEHRRIAYETPYADEPLNGIIRGFVTGLYGMGWDPDMIAEEMIAYVYENYEDVYNKFINE